VETCVKVTFEPRGSSRLHMVNQANRGPREVYATLKGSRYSNVALQQRRDTTTSPYKFAWRRRSAFPITDSELSVIAALAQTGVMRRPETG
jgi:hypothetical protein